MGDVIEEYHTQDYEQMPVKKIDDKQRRFLRRLNDTIKKMLGINRG